jgi:GNAT superfamily N-acetyltransferase
VIAVRRARAADAVAIGAVHVAVWRSAYAGILPDSYLARLSVSRQAVHYDAAIRGGGVVHVATAAGADVPGGSAPRIVGFATGGRGRSGTALLGQGSLGQGVLGQGATVRRLGDAEIETLYVLDDWRERGIGRRLMRGVAGQLAETGCRSAFVWVLRDNPSRWFYHALGGRPAAESVTSVAGSPVVQTAFVWDPIEKLLQPSAQSPRREAPP